MENKLKVIAITNGVVPRRISPSAPLAQGKRVTYTNTLLESDKDTLKRVAYWSRKTERRLLDEMFAAWRDIQHPAYLLPIPDKL